LSDTDHQAERSRPCEGNSVSPLGLRRELNVFDAGAVVVGTIIGSGIFLLPSFVAAQIDSFGGVLLVWIIGGLLTLFGALSLAELGSIYPGTGGLCTYLRRIYGPLPAFLYAWALLVMVHSGSIAALGVAFGLYSGQVFHLNGMEEKVCSVIPILILTSVSCLGIRGGKLVQNSIAVAKISGLAALIILLGLKGSRPVHLFDFTAPVHSHAPSFAGFGIALIAVLWAYEGWHVVSFVAGEMKRPKLDLPRSLFFGSAIVLLIFVAANLGYYHTLSAAEIRGSDAVAALAVQKAVGSTASICLSFLILASVLGSMNGLILTGPRVYYAMARDSVFPRAFGQLSDRYRTPMVALTVQGVWAAMLAASGNYQQLFTDVIFTAWIFYGLAVAGVLVLRRRQPQLPRPFSVPGYPCLSLLFCAAAAYVILTTFMERPGGASLGIGLLASGIPVYLLNKRGQFKHTARSNTAFLESATPQESGEAGRGNG
jgi:basic amino acid/polyamine antiporter, APA family